MGDKNNQTTGNSTEIDSLTLNLEVKGADSGKSVRSLATAISRLNDVLKDFNNEKFSNFLDTMSTKLNPFLKKVGKVSRALESLSDIVKRTKLDDAMKEMGKMPEIKTKDVQGGSGKGKPKQSIGVNPQQLDEAKSDLEEVDDSLRDIDNKWDLLVAKGIEVEKSLDKEKLSAKQILSLVSQRLTIENQLNQITKKEETAQQLAEAQTQAQKFRDSLSGVTDKVALMKIQLEQVQNALKESGLTESKYLSLKKQELKLTEQIAKAESGGGDDDDKKTEKKASPFGKLVKSFGRIAMYRAVRRAIQEITQAFTESIDGIARYNSEFRDTMGSLQSSMAKLKTSIGVGLYQVLIVLEPVITAISNGIVDLANSLSKVTANLRGVAEYTKINTEYMKDYQSATQGALLSFDTFNTLSSNQGIDYSQMLDTGTDALDTEGFNETETVLKDLLLIVQELFKTLSTLWKSVKPSIKTVLNTLLKFIPAIDKLVVALAPVLNKFVETIFPIAFELIESILPVVVPIIEQIADALNSVMYLLKPIIDLAINSVKMMVAVITLDFEGMFDTFTDGWKNVGEFFVRTWKTIANGFASIINSIANAFIAFVNNCIDGLNMILSPIDAIAGIFDGEVKIKHWNAKVNWKPYAYADGGMMTNASGQFAGAGTMYALAGESGAEVVATGSAGTGVLNVDQFADAMVSALVRYGAARDTSNGTTIVLDGNKVGQLVASNVGFRNEANRRNAGLNWK